MKRMKRNWIAAGVSGALFLLLILTLRLVDVQEIGPEGTQIGLATVNGAIRQWLGFNEIWYKITGYLGYGAILMAAGGIVAICVQAIQRRGIKKVNRELLALGAVYLLLIGLYVFFEIVVINYRPIILPGDEHPEASFPSSHTMLACTIMGSAIILAEKYLRSRKLRVVVQIALGLYALMTVVGRLLSGVHWFTDILGGVLAGATLLFLLVGMITGGSKE
ncbi:MAG: phosphatase PAP2 family protein [Christensenellaceae bacterium]